MAEPFNFNPMPNKVPMPSQAFEAEMASMHRRHAALPADQQTYEFDPSKNIIPRKPSKYDLVQKSLQLQDLLDKPMRFDAVYFPFDMATSDDVWDRSPPRARRYLRDLFDMGIRDRTEIYPEEMIHLRNKQAGIPSELDTKPGEFPKGYSDEAEVAMDLDEHACGRFRDYYRRCLRDLDVGHDEAAPRLCVAQAFNVWKCRRRMVCSGQEVQHKMFCNPELGPTNNLKCGSSEAKLVLCLDQFNLMNMETTQEMADVFRRNRKVFGSPFGPNLDPVDAPTTLPPKPPMTLPSRQPQKEK